MKKAPIITLGVVILLFIISWVFKSSSVYGVDENYLLYGMKYTIAAFLTLAIFSFLYQDNPYYKFAEHLFVGVSAAFWMSMGFWTTIVGNLVPRVSESLSNFFKVPYNPDNQNLFYFVPVVLGILLLMRLTKKYGWISRWPLAFIVGTTAGLNFIRYLRSDFINQVKATFVPLVINWHGLGNLFSNFSLSSTGPFIMMMANWIIFLGVFCGLIYFYFSKEHKGAFGFASRIGVWILMITFGASFGYTVMGRISLLVGRLTFLFHDWLGLIN
ncbi:MAG: hypothetical protein ABIJ12_13325 [bacterium]